MANTTIDQLPQATSVSSDDVVAAMQNGETVAIPVGLLVPAPPQDTSTRIISGGGVAWTGTNFDYIISACDYLINGVQYHSDETQVQLEDADPADDRIDTFYADADGLAGVITGTPATNPVAPSVDPASQIFLTFAAVDAGSTEPAINTVDIYLENTEWTTSANAGTINLASTNNPFAGSKDIEGTNVAKDNLFTAVKPSGTVKPSDYTNLVLEIRSKATWPNQKAISIFWLNGTSPVGVAAALKHGTFGFDSSNTTSYQQIVIPTSTFNTGAADVDRIRFQITGGSSNIGFYIDNITLQGGGSGTTSGGDFSTNTNTSVPNEIVLFADTTGKLGKRSTGTGTAILTNGVLGTRTDKSIIGATWYNAGSAVDTGKAAGFIAFPMAGTITAWAATVDTGTATFKVWKKATGTAKPTSSDSINTSGVSISTGTHVRSTTLSDFTTTTVTANDIFAFNLEATTGNPTEMSFQVEITK